MKCNSRRLELQEKPLDIIGGFDGDGGRQQALAIPALAVEYGGVDAAEIEPRPVPRHLPVERRLSASLSAWKRPLTRLARLRAARSRREQAPIISGPSIWLVRASIESAVVMAHAAGRGPVPSGRAETRAARAGSRRHAGALVYRLFTLQARPLARSAAGPLCICEVECIKIRTNCSCLIRGHSGRIYHSPSFRARRPPTAPRGDLI